jgi:beta-glucosidase
LKKVILSLASVAAFTSLSSADEMGPPTFGRSIFISGDVGHYKTAPDIKVNDSKNPGAFAEEIYSPKEFTVQVEGLPAGTYTAVVDLAEVYRDAPDQRIMRITAGDKVIADHFDLFKAAGGKAKPYQLRFQVAHEADQIRGPLSITFASVKDAAKLNAITILNSAGKPVAGTIAKDLKPSASAFARVIPNVKTPPIYNDPTKPFDARIDDLISRMSLAEKVSQIVSKATGIERLGIPAYNYWSEALHGVGRNGAATVFPQAIGLAATWDEALVHKIGEVIATEGRAKYYKTIQDGEIGRENAGLNYWAPNVNIFRDPRWGRGQETYGEDPFLTGRIGVNYVEGVQGTDPKYPGYYKAMATAKHFAVHSGPEKGRGHFNVNPTTRDLRETYLPQFQMIVQEANVRGIMAAYNSIYGVPCAADDWLLTDLLRKEWGFTGHVVSDCGAVSQIAGEKHYMPNGEMGTSASVASGLDLECGGSFAALTKAVEQKIIDVKKIDQALHRVLDIRFRLGLFDPPATAPFSGVPASEIESAPHLQLALQAARESMTLLKNDGLLPLDKMKLKRIAVVGPNADNRTVLLGNYHGEPTNPVKILDGIKAAVGPNVKVDYVKGTDLLERPDRPAPDPAEFQKAVAAAKAADVVIFVSGNDESIEGEESSLEAPGFYHGDRTTIEIQPNQEKLLEAVHATGKPVVLVSCTGSSVAFPWAVKNIPAILQAWYPGGEGGTAVADVLFGNYNPAGRLPVTFYAKTEDLPDFADYRMANRTYRYFTGTPLYAFGHGLSYTKFDYAPAQLVGGASLPASGSVKLRVPVKNTGARDGDEVVQVYLKNNASKEPQPKHSLVAFRRVPIAKGATANVDFEIPVSRFHYWDTVKNAYVVDPGAYELQVGGASDDIRQTAAVTVTQ